MKITLNLSPAASTRDRYALAWAVPAILAGLVGLVFLGRASLQEYRQYRSIQSQLSEVQMRADALQDQESAIRRKLEAPAYRELLREARFVNKLIDQRELSLTELSARVTGLLPGDAHLTGLALNAPRKPGDDYMVRIGINAKDEDSVETFVNDLEDSPDFKDVSILNQGFQEESVQGDQVIIVCTARYLPEAVAELEAATEAPEVETKKPAAGIQAAGAKSLKPAGKTPAPQAGSKKAEKGAGHSRAEESTPNRKPNR